MFGLATVVPVLSLFARGGGGGSGGGGGVSLIALVGYVPMHLLGAFIRKSQRKHQDIFDALQVGGWLVCIAYAAVLIFLLHGIGIIMAAGAFAGMGAGLYNWFSKIKQNKAVKTALQLAADQDGVWNETRLTAHATEVFGRFQTDWSNNNAEAMKTYLTSRYQNHNALMIDALRLADRRNMVTHHKVTDMAVVDMHDAADNARDSVTIAITARAEDRLIDERSGTVLFVDKSPFTEYWRFVRSGDTWLLDDIDQATASALVASEQLERFAGQNGYYYSLDWGWLLLPERGQLFGEGKFGTSDINNHVIGVCNQQLLVQLYTYIPNPQSGWSKNYLIAQASLPKSYGDIVVRRKQGLHLFGIRGLQEVSTEWPDFNKKYQVFATSPEQATSLELLNPRYMEQLEAAPFEINIEVVENVVYLYAPEKALQAEHYPVMLSLLQAAFKEMRM